VFTKLSTALFVFMVSFLIDRFSLWPRVLLERHLSRSRPEGKRVIKTN
jgi:hypothetical protein